jgi:hypothetical protein
MKREKRRAGLVAAVLMIVGLICAEASSSAIAFTMGSSLSRDPDVSEQGTAGPITVFDYVISSGLRVGGEQGPLYSPVDGRVVRWRIRTGDFDTGPVALRVIKGRGSLASAPRTGAGTSPTVTPSLGTISTYDVDLPIHRGDAIGLDCCWPDPGQFFAGFFTTGFEIAGLDVWGDPPLADGGAPRAADDEDVVELAVNADIEPTTTFTISSVRQVRKHRLRVSATFPNLGTVLAGDPRDLNIGGTTYTPPRRGLLFTTSGRGFGTRAGDTAPYPVSFLLKPTKRAQRILRRKGKLTGKIKVAYTPGWGSVVTQTTEFRLKL